MKQFFAILVMAGFMLTSAAFAETAGKTLVLKDGTQIEVSADNSVSVINADGSKTPAPDGAHTLKDGSTVNTKDGKKVAE